VLVPSWEEPFGRSIVEAMAAATAVAATAVGGPAEIVEDGRTGLLLGPRRPDLWAEALGELLAQPARLAEVGRLRRVQARRRFGVERHVAAVRAVYEAVLSGERVRAGAGAVR